MVSVSNGFSGSSERNRKRNNNSNNDEKTQQLPSSKTPNASKKSKHNHRIASSRSSLVSSSRIGLPRAFRPPFPPASAEEDQTSWNLMLASLVATTKLPPCPGYSIPYSALSSPHQGISMTMRQLGHAKTTTRYGCSGCAKPRVAAISRL